VRLGVRDKLFIGFGAVLLLTAIVGYIAWRNTSDYVATSEASYSERLLPTIQLGATQQALYELRLGAASLRYQAADEATRTRTKGADQQWLKQVDDNIRAFRATSLVPEEVEGLRIWDQAYPAFLRQREQVVALVDQGRAAEANALRDGEMARVLGQASETLGKMIEVQERLDREESQEVIARAGGSRLALAGAIALALLIGGGVALFLSRAIARGVGEVAAAAAGIAEGDLDQHIGVRSGDEVGQLADAARGMIASLRGLTVELQESAQSLAGASHEILAATSQQSSSASEQAAAIAETTATVEEVKASADQAVQVAMAVSTASQQATRVAGEGVAAARSAAHGMEDLRHRVRSIADNILALSEQRDQIGEIIATVNDLADQSNLLALNAAIEASRAGEQGKGFAVVAEEIRSLADQSKQATAQVRTILSEIQRATNAAVMATEQGTKGAEAGAELVERTGRTIDELANVIGQAAQSAEQIAASVRQHSVGMEQIAVAMTNINQATTQSLSATESTQQAARNLTELAARLGRLVARYKV
jgi:methyl-accepting chemotaxis protein